MSKLALLHSEWPKLHQLLADLSAVGLKCKTVFSQSLPVTHFQSETVIPKISLHVFHNKDTLQEEITLPFSFFPPFHRSKLLKEGIYSWGKHMLQLVLWKEFYHPRKQTGSQKVVLRSKNGRQPIHFK